jgi:hypothetical protein
MLTTWHPLPPPWPGRSNSTGGLCGMIGPPGMLALFGLISLSGLIDLTCLASFDTKGQGSNTEFHGRFINV